MGDLDALIASIERDGLLQPITITPDGLLVCGARRLAAIRRLGWRTVSVWVRSSISTRLGHLLAEQDDNQLHKMLSPLEAAELYREIKQLMAEDAARREAAGQFSSEYQPRWNGSADSAEPLTTPKGDSRKQAAQMVTGAASYTRLEQIGHLQRLADDPDTPDALRTQAREGLMQIDAGAPVDPIYQRLRDAHREVEAGRDANLHALASQAIARVQGAKAKNKPTRKRPAVTGPDATARSNQRSVRRVPIFPPDKIRRLPFGTGIVLLRSAPPIVTDLHPWPSRPDAAQLTADRAEIEALLRRPAS